jgi:hypothetical protein
MAPKDSALRSLVEKLWAGRHLRHMDAQREFPPLVWRARLLRAALSEMEDPARASAPYDPGYDDRFAWAWARITQIQGGSAPESNLTFRCGFVLEGCPVLRKDAAAGETPTLAQGS